MKGLLISHVQGAMLRLTGRRYAIRLEDLDEASLRELLRLTGDVEQEKRTAALNEASLRELLLLTWDVEQEKMAALRKKLK